MDPTQKDQLSDLTNSVQVATPLHHYVNAFNARDQLAMSSVFAENLLTIHPMSPKLTLIVLNPFW